jgi:hypothetical protein
MNLAAVVPLAAVLVPPAVCLRGHRDARADAVAGTPIHLRIGALRPDTPEGWAIGCAVFFVAFLPLHLAARRR